MPTKTHEIDASRRELLLPIVENPWGERSRRYLQAELTLRGMSRQDLTDALNRRGVRISKSAIDDLFTGRGKKGPTIDSLYAITSALAEVDVPDWAKASSLSGPRSAQAIGLAGSHDWPIVYLADAREGHTPEFRPSVSRSQALATEIAKRPSGRGTGADSRVPRLRVTDP